MAYRLFYWALRGRGEQVRLLLNELDQDESVVSRPAIAAYLASDRRIGKNRSG